MQSILVLGAGGHGKVVADILQCQGYIVLGLLDDDSTKWGMSQLGLPILSDIEGYRNYPGSGLVMGIGANRIRRAIVERLGECVNPLWQPAIHPRATVASSAYIAPGSVVSAGAVINVDVRIDIHTIINTGATVDHDCVIEPYAHVAPGANLAGDVHVCEGALIGVGASVIPGCRIGKWATIGAGAVVVRDVPDNVIAKGVPARW